MRLVLASALVLLAACSADRQSAGEGIASLSPALTHTLLALDLQSELVARSDYDRAPEVEDLPIAGTSLSPNLEVLARLRPEAIVTDASGAFDHELDRIAPVISLAWTSLKDMEAGIQRIGERFDRKAAAATLIGRLHAMQQVPRRSPCPRLLVILQPQSLAQLWYMPSNSIHGALVPASGGCHAVPESVSGAAVLGPEALLRVDPDIIVVLAEGQAAAVVRDSSLVLADLPSLKAVSNARIIALSAPGVLIPGPNLPNLADELTHKVDVVWPP